MFRRSQKQRIVIESPSCTRERGVNSLEKWKEEEIKTWDENIFTNTEIKVGNPLATKDDVAKTVLVEPTDPKMEKSIQELYRETYPELDDIIDDFGTLEQVTRVKCQAPKNYTRKTIIKICHNSTDEDLWEKISRLRDETTDFEWIALHQVTCMSPQRLQKMVECIFFGKMTKVCLFTTNIVNPQSANKSPRERKTYALVVEDKVKDFNSILKNVKDKIGKTNSGDLIRKIRSTKDGKLLITTDKDECGLKNLQIEIEKIMDTISVRSIWLDNKTEVIHIRGLDATTDKEEIKRAIEEKIGPTSGKMIKISELRPNANHTAAVTLALGKVKADLLLKDNQIRTGLVRCKMEKRLEVKKCTRCWACDHKTADCQGPDRRSLCFKCGKERHPSKECTEEEACPMCQERRHKAGSGKCQAFRRALSRARKTNRQATRSSLDTDENNEMVIVPSVSEMLLDTN
ncbi:hypothetical protein NQ314_013778 [Rhamnusium bicolor]|uniref:CCHC-type domain-containing protein n=1 Tax=Rhamnusium bicolor TaxID=1586634 RepID=A0AAV8X4D7_9CUCU|nr:hypothetical protein NQ314_013778 [Rhamnusium bicolor]